MLLSLDSLLPPADLEDGRSAAVYSLSSPAEESADALRSHGDSLYEDGSLQHESDCGDDSFVLQSTSDLVPVLAELDLNRAEQEEESPPTKASPQYVGPRLSAARRSAQVLPGEVKALLRDDIELQSFQRTPRSFSVQAGPDSQAARCRRWSASSLVEPRPPGSERGEVSKATVQPGFHRSPSLEQHLMLAQQNDELYSSLQSAQETVERQHRALEDSNSNLHSLMRRLQKVESALDGGSRGGFSPAQAPAQPPAQSDAAGEARGVERDGSQAHQQDNKTLWTVERALDLDEALVAKDRRIQSLQNQIVSLQNQIKSLQAQSLASSAANKQRLESADSEARRLAIQAAGSEHEATALRAQLAQDGDVIVMLRQKLKGAEGREGDSAAAAARSQARAEAALRENAYLQERLALLSRENDGLRMDVARCHATSRNSLSTFLPATAPEGSRPSQQPNRFPAVDELAARTSSSQDRSCVGRPLAKPSADGTGTSDARRGGLQRVPSLMLPSAPGLPDLPPTQNPRRATDSCLSTDPTKQRPAGLETPRNGCVDIIKALPDTWIETLIRAPLTTPRLASKPYATDSSLQEFMQQTKQLEDRLMAVNAEKDQLQGELARLPENGRTLAERHRRTVAETRLAALNREAGTLRMNLKQMGAMHA